MQVIGAMLALVIAIGLPYWQKWSADKENFIRARQCLLMQCALISALRFHVKTADEGPVEALSSARKECANLLLSYDDVRAPGLSLRQLTIWRMARVTAEQLSELLAKGAAAQIADDKVDRALELLLNSSAQHLDSLGVTPDRTAKMHC
jgi:hypothetical protein